MPIALSLDEIAERLGNKDDPAFSATIASIFYHAEDGGFIVPSKMVKEGDGYVRKFAFALESDVPKKTVMFKDGKIIEVSK